MEVRQVLVICEDLYGERGTVEVMSPRLQSADDCEEFAVVDIIVSLHGNERLGEVQAWVPVAVRIGLKENST